MHLYQSVLADSRPTTLFSAENTAQKAVANVAPKSRFGMTQNLK